MEYYAARSNRDAPPLSLMIRRTFSLMSKKYLEVDKTPCNNGGPRDSGGSHYYTVFSCTFLDFFVYRMLLTNIVVSTNKIIN